MRQMLLLIAVLSVILLPPNLIKYNEDDISKQDIEMLNLYLDILYNQSKPLSPAYAQTKLLCTTEAESQLLNSISESHTAKEQIDIASNKMLNATFNNLSPISYEKFKQLKSESRASFKICWYEVMHSNPSMFKDTAEGGEYKYLIKKRQVFGLHLGLTPEELKYM
tara:strand:+ start:917 stop:1414 length:498 start_codon:yes stop_codon:yes gene_type:complete